MAETGLRDGLEMLRKGWFKAAGGSKHIMHGDGESCAIIAAKSAALGRATDVVDIRTLNDVVGELWPDRTLCGSAHNACVNWNNHPATTFDDIEVGFEKAAIRREEAV